MFRVNLPVALLIWLMILPMLLKIDFRSLQEVRQHWKGVGVTLFVGVREGVAVTLLVGVNDGVGVIDAVEDTVGVTLFVGVIEAVGVTDAVGDTVGVTLLVGVRLGVAD